MKIGRDAALLEVGYRSPRSDTGVQQMLRAIQSNLAFNMFYTITYLKDTTHPAMKFKIKFTDGSFPEKSKSTMTLQGVLMNLEVPDTKDKHTWRKAFS